MKRGAMKIDNVIKKTLVAFIFFILFSILVLCTATIIELCTKGPTLLMILGFLESLILMVIFMMLFLSSWEEIFKPEDEDL